MNAALLVIFMGMIVFVWIDLVFLVTPRLDQKTRWRLVVVLTLSVPVLLRLLVYNQLFWDNLLSGAMIIESSSFFATGRDMVGFEYFRAVPHVYHSFIDYMLLGFSYRLGFIDFSTMPWVHGVMGCLSIPATYLLGARLLGPKPALLAAFWMGISIWVNAQFINAYVFMDPLFYTLAYLALLTAMNRRSRFWYFVCGLGVGVGTLFRLGPPVPLLLIWLVLRAHGAPRRRAALGWILLGFAASLTPILYDMLTVNPLWPIMVLSTMLVKGVAGAPMILGAHLRIFHALTTLAFLALDLSLPFFVGGAAYLAWKKLKIRKLDPGESFLALWSLVMLASLAFVFSYTDTAGGLAFRPPRYYILLFPAPYLIAALAAVKWRASKRFLARVHSLAHNHITIYALIVVVVWIAIGMVSGHARKAMRSDDPIHGVDTRSNSLVLSNFPLSKLHSTIEDFELHITLPEFRDRYMDWSSPKPWRNIRSEYNQYPYQFYDDAVSRGAAAFDYDFGTKRLTNRLIFGAFPVADFQGFESMGRPSGEPVRMLLAVMTARGIETTGFMARIRHDYHQTVAGNDYAEALAGHNPEGLTLVHHDRRIDVKYFQVEFQPVRFTHAVFRFRSHPIEPEPGVVPVSLGNLYMEAFGYGLGHNLSHFWRQGIDPESEFDGLFIRQYKNSFTIRTEPGRYRVRVRLDAGAQGGRICVDGRCRDAARGLAEPEPGLRRIEPEDVKRLRIYKDRMGRERQEFHFQVRDMQFELELGPETVIEFDPGHGWLLIDEIELESEPKPAAAPGFRFAHFAWSP